MATVKKVGKPTKIKKEKEPLFTLETGSEIETGENLKLLSQIVLKNTETICDGEWFLITKGQLKIFQIEVSQLPGCCGVMVLNSYTVLPGYEKSLIEFLDELVDHSTSNGTTFQITTAQNVSCVNMANVLSKCKNWTAVKTFKNASSSKNVTIWISNND